MAQLTLTLLLVILCPSHIQLSVHPLSTANDREGNKISHHSANSDSNGMICVPFGIETFGAFGNNAQKLLFLLDQQAALQPWYIPSVTPAKTRARLLACLFHGNLRAFHRTDGSSHSII